MDMRKKGSLFRGPPPQNLNPCWVAQANIGTRAAVRASGRSKSKRIGWKTERSILSLEKKCQRKEDSKVGLYFDASKEVLS
jgi:hypothetical protein